MSTGHGSTRTVDVLVAGGGPAGLAVAIGAARAGLDVLVYERRPGVIDKACGEGLMPGALANLQALGVDPPGWPMTGITYRQARRSVGGGEWVARAGFRDGPGRGVRRTVLHEAMRDAAAAAGARICTGTIDALEQTPDLVRAGGVRARYLVGADGLHSPVRTRVGLDGGPARAAPRWGLRQHFALAPDTGQVEVTWAAHSEAYVTPVAADQIGIAILTSRRGSFTDQLAAFPALAARVAGQQPISTSRGAGPLRQRVAARVRGRVLLVGDAAGYIDALTGEGLAVSLAAAAQLVECLRRDRPQDYEAAWRRVSRRSRWITASLLAARRRPALAPRIVPLAAHAPKVFTLAVNQLAG
jgi:flavin-dependent dehydrogenase